MKRYTLIVIVSVFDRRCCILNKMLMYIMWSVHRGNSKPVLVCIQTTSTRKFILLVLHKTWITPIPSFLSARDAKFKYSQTSLYEHLIITDSLLCPWGKKAPTSVFSKFNPLNTDTPFTDTFEFHGSLSACVSGGGYFRNFWVGMCRWDPGTLNLYQS